MFTKLHTARRGIASVLFFVICACLVAYKYTSYKKPIEPDLSLLQYMEIEKPLEAAETSITISDLNLNETNFPILDGATATQPIRGFMLCKGLKLLCEWRQETNKEMFTYPAYSNFSKGGDYTQETNRYKTVVQKNRNSKTHDAYLALINKDVDLVLMATEPSQDELREAKNKNVKLKLTPIGLDGFVFLVNSKNPITDLTTEQIKSIYTGKVTNWKQFGGDDEKIDPFVRQRNSGSQELMEKVFMKGDAIKKFPEEKIIESMVRLVEGVDQKAGAIGYSLYYYKNTMVDKLNTNPRVRVISVDGVGPSTSSISGKEYPYVFNIYAVTREDLDKNSLAYKLKLWLTTEQGQELVKEAGYSPITN